MQNNGPSSLTRAQRAIILHTLGVQVVAPSNDGGGPTAYSWLGKGWQLQPPSPSLCCGRDVEIVHKWLSYGSLFYGSDCNRVPSPISPIWEQSFRPCICFRGFALGFLAFCQRLTLFLGSLFGLRLGERF